MMVAPPPSQARRIPVYKARSSVDEVSTATDAPPPIPPDMLMQRIAAHVATDAERWHTDLSVPIGRASALTGLSAPQIRYLEDLHIFQATKTTESEGATRLYTLSDLRRLSAVAALLKESYRPAEAAQLVREHADLIEHGHAHSLDQLFAQESSVISDGFVLARLMSQIMAVVQAELSERTGSTVQVEGLLFPFRPLPVSLRRATAIQEYGETLLRDLAKVLVAIRLEPHSSETDACDTEQSPHTMQESDYDPMGRNDRTVVFYSAAPQQPYLRPPVHFCLSVSPDAPEQPMLVLLRPNNAATLPVRLGTCEPSRQYLLDHLLAMTLQLSEPFRQTSFLKNYRYRSDGFEISLTRATLGAFAQTIRTILFPDDSDSMIVLLLPNSLDAPTSLSILAHAGYREQDASRFRLDLRGTGQGLAGRAYNLREPFLSLDCAHDPRVAYAMDEHSHAALAVPLTTTWGIQPFGVLYLAVRNPTHTISRDQAFMAMVLGSLLSELLGRWWLTRLRRTQDEALFAHMQVVQQWFDSLDGVSPALSQALDYLQELWQKMHCTLQFSGQQQEWLDPLASLSFIIFDIKKYRLRVQQRRNDIIPARAQQHINAVIERVLPGQAHYWFKNDHVLLILEQRQEQDIQHLIERITRQVHALPLRLPGNERLKISVAHATETISYHELHDLDPTGGADLRARLITILDDLRQRAGGDHDQEA